MEIGFYRNSHCHNIKQNCCGLNPLLFQTAILTTETVDFDEDKRLELAFGHSIKDFNEMQFLTKFANFGVTILKEKLMKNF